MEIQLLDGELVLGICYEKSDKEFKDNICLKFHEQCSDETRIFRAMETNLFITAQQARELAAMLTKAAQTSDPL
jgi:hypothetical protein